MRNIEDRLEEFESIMIEIRPGGTETEWYPMRLLEDLVDKEAGCPIPPRVVVSLYAVEKNHDLRRRLGRPYCQQQQCVGEGKKKKTSDLEYFTGEQMRAALEPS